MTSNDLLSEYAFVKSNGDLYFFGVIILIGIIIMVLFSVFDKTELKKYSYKIKVFFTNGKEDIIEGMFESTYKPSLSLVPDKNYNELLLFGSSHVLGKRIALNVTHYKIIAGDIKDD